VGAEATLSRNFQESFLKPLLDDDSVRLSLRAGTLETLSAALRAHDLDVVLSHRTPAHADELVCRAIAAQEVSLVGPRGTRFRFPDDLARVPLLLSMHDFERTPAPESLLAAFAHMAALGADIVKLAVMPRSEADVMALLEATSHADRSLAIPVVGISMGELGTPSRVIGHRFGSRITWCSGLEASAPGQLPLELLRRLVEQSRAP
jgi:hypothetical protein